jgi:predicted nucleotidyltransferase
MVNSKYILNEIKRLVVEKASDAKVYLYGSRARGTANKESDWDLLILLNKERITPEIEEEITFSLYDLEFETGEVISPMVYSEKEWNTKYKITSFYHNVMQEGKLLCQNINLKIIPFTECVELMKQFWKSRLT